jgi:cytochrome c biogenesis protein CcmG/thiol:disulfide interchange protein DsbE
MSEQVTSQTPPARRGLLMLLPLIVFAGLAVLFWLRLGDGDPSRIPSALIGHPAPQTTLPPLAGLTNDGTQVPGLNPAIFKGKVSVVNVWASWCVPCHDEAPLLTELGKDKRLQLVGINYKDAPDNARRFLGRYGNPFGVVGVDGNGDLHRRPRRKDRLQAGRPGDPGQFRHRAQGRNREGAEGRELAKSSRHCAQAKQSRMQSMRRQFWIASSLTLLAMAASCGPPPTSSNLPHPLRSPPARPVPDDSAWSAASGRWRRSSSAESRRTP